MCKDQHFGGQILVYLLHSEVLIFLMHLWKGERAKPIQLPIYVKRCLSRIFFFSEKEDI